MKKIFSIFAMLVMAITASASITITKSGGWFESAFIEFTLDEENFNGYNVYYSTDQSSWKKIDAALVRKYQEHGRADAVGITGGTSLNSSVDYYMKVVPTNDGIEQTSEAQVSGKLTVKPHDRTGFAFMGSQMPGAYQANGTLKPNAVVVYVTNDNKNTIKESITYTNKGGLQECQGLLAILTAYKKGNESRPLCIRFIGDIKKDFIFYDFEKGGTYNIDDAKDFKGDIMLTSNKKDLGGVTIEGIGNDAVANGWGIRFKGLNYGEIRNLGFMNCCSDEGDDVGLQQDNMYSWVHNCDMFYGNAGSDKDQVKGDGALDCKKSNFVTFSYNHFWDCGKCNLLGLSEGTKSYESNPYFITYHHNWYDHSDSRHPRVRFYNAHVYNNYYDGNSKYGAGSTLGSSVFVENNYFRNCKNPMMTSMQGTDVYAGTTTRDDKENPTFSKEDGGVIKAFNNFMEGTYTFIPYGAEKYVQKGKLVDKGSINTNVDYDAYVVENKTDKVPNTIKSYKGANYYSNFDTSNSMYAYTAETPEQAVETIKGTYGAGRMQGGDFSWGFTSADDPLYDVNTALKSALTNYENTDFVGLFSDDTSSEGGDDTPTTLSDATLKSLSVAGYSISFKASTLNYNVALAAGTTTAPAVSAVANNNKATIQITQASALPGSATVLVTAEDGVSKITYTVNFTVTPDDPEPTPVDEDVTLKSLSVEGYSITPTFSAGTTTYNVVLADGTTDVPAISAVPTDANATVTIDTEDCHPAGQAIIFVTGENGTQNKYFINFTLNTPTGDISTIFRAYVPQAPSSNVSGNEGTNMSSCATVAGGSMIYHGGSGTLIDKKSIYMRINSNSSYYEIQLNQALAAGDVISYTTSDEREICFTTTATRATTLATSSHVYTVTAGDGLAGATTIYIWRATGSTTRFNDLKIQRTATTGVDNVKANDNLSVPVSVKVFKNGKLIIEKNGRQYNAAGQRVE